MNEKDIKKDKPELYNLIQLLRYSTSARFGIPLSLFNEPSGGCGEKVQSAMTYLENEDHLDVFKIPDEDEDKMFVYVFLKEAVEE